MTAEPEMPQPRLRSVAEILAARPTIEGAGVHLRRAFGAAEVPRLDPFLLLDDFRSENPAEYIAGFPWHPHRGIETVTYMLDGRVEHEDSIGNKGIIGQGDVQWMSAGSGIIHQEMPKVDRHRLGGFQLWVNMPRARKMSDPRYQEVKSGRISEVESKISGSTPSTSMFASSRERISFIPSRRDTPSSPTSSMATRVSTKRPRTSSRTVTS